MSEIRVFIPPSMKRNGGGVAWKWIKMSAFSIVLMATLSDTAYACTCIDTTPWQRFSRADLVFDAEVLTIGDMTQPRGVIREWKVVELRVVDLWKGASASAIVEVITPADTAGCGVRFQEANRWSVYADILRADDRPMTSHCSGTSSPPDELRGQHEWWRYLMRTNFLPAVGSHM